MDRGGGIGGLLYSLRDSGNAVRFSHYNARGDVVSQTNDLGIAQWQASYEAFGTHERESGSNPDSQRANTKEEDPTGLLNEGFRYRDLATGTFITRDPAGFVDGPNLYTYVQQNPWSKFDPEGLWLEDAVLGIPSFAVGAVSLADSVRRGKIGSAAWDVAGMVIDGVAIALPGIPGGAGLATKAARAAASVAKKGEKVIEVVEKAEKAETAVDVATAVTTGDPSAFVAIGLERATGGKKKASLPEGKTAKQTTEEAQAVSKKESENARRRGIYHAKGEERSLVESGHPGTADGGWSLAERKQIAETGQYPKDTRWHHINDVKRHPELADKADNVLPSRGGTARHVEKYHPNGTQNGSSGPLLDRRAAEAEHRGAQE